MSTAPVPYAELEALAGAYREALEDGFAPPGRSSRAQRGASARAAEVLGLDRRVAADRLTVASALGLAVPGWTALPERRRDALRARYQVLDPTYPAHRAHSARLLDPVSLDAPAARPPAGLKTFAGENPAAGSKTFAGENPGSGPRIFAGENSTAQGDLVAAISAAVAAVLRPAPEPPRRVYAQPAGPGTAQAGSMFGTQAKAEPKVVEEASDEVVRDLVLGDSHFHPAIVPQATRMMTLCGLHAVAIGPRNLVHIGDAGDWASVCRHVRNDTYRARFKPRIDEDFEAFRTCWAALNRPMDEAGVTASRHFTQGNHEAWLVQHEEAVPECYGQYTGELDGIMALSGWHSYPFGEYVFIGGVAYTHVPLNLMGRPAGGQTAENTVALQSVYDTVIGHTHRFAMGRRVKFGPAQAVTVLNAGSTMPFGYVGDYAQRSQGSHVDSGVLEVVRKRGRIIGWAFRSAEELEALYGPQADKLLG